jgi:hypothetical protein
MNTFTNVGHEAAGQMNGPEKGSICARVQICFSAQDTTKDVLTASKG